MRVHVKPAEGARIRQPERGSAVMGPEGDFVERGVFYEAHIAAGSLIVTDKEPPRPGAPPARTATPPDIQPAAEAVPPAARSTNADKVKEK